MSRAFGWVLLFSIAVTPAVSGPRDDSSVSLAPADTRKGAEILAAIRKVRLDSTQLYRVHDATFHREDLRIYLIEGTLAFLQSVEGKVT